VHAIEDLTHRLTHHPEPHAAESPARPRV
jgi:hypothetical protein